VAGFRDEIHLLKLSNTPSLLSTIQLRRSNDRFWPISARRQCDYRASANATLQAAVLRIKTKTCRQ
jgi:hypothetical protein